MVHSITRLKPLLLSLGWLFGLSCFSSILVYPVVSSSSTTSSSSNTAVPPRDTTAATMFPPVTDDDDDDDIATAIVPLVLAVDGGTESIRACCFDARTGRVVGRSCAAPYPTKHPVPGWAEQDPHDWYDGLCAAVRGALASVRDKEGEGGGSSSSCRLRALCVDTTCCSVVALDGSGHPLRPCLLWMDQRAASQAEEISTACRGHAALRVNGDGPVSAEWMLPKALWMRQKEPHVWRETAVMCEYQDYLNAKLTGRFVASTCNAVTRWHYDGHGGRPPLSLYAELGIPELADKLPTECIAMGTRVGNLTARAAADLGLPVDLPVVQGGPDAFVGMLGLGCVRPGQSCLITGSSHLHCVVTDTARTARGIWGAYRGAPLPHMLFAEGGQSSTGSLLRWARNLFTASSSDGDADDADASGCTYAALDDMAAAIPPGADGLIACETFQGSRTPVTDPMARGAFVGLTLSHTRGHLWRALMEAVCFGTRACLEGLAAAGHDCDEIVLAGGIAKSPLWLQMHADVTGKPVVVCENTDAPLLGCAILASVGIGIHPDVDAACQAMVRVAKRIEPDETTHATYTRIYHTAYRPMVESVRDISHTLSALRGGAAAAIVDTDVEGAQGQRHERKVIISPSLLACDWGNIRQEVQRCLNAGANRLHVDVFDGVFLKSPRAFTFGPAMVQVIRESLQDVPQGQLDLHMCVENPARFVDVMAEAAPGHCFVFQWEAVPTTEIATELAQQIVEAGMKCGVSLNPSTPLEAILPLLETGLISVVDVLAVEPGFGGQNMQASVLNKIRYLRQWIDTQQKQLEFQVMVDGGVNEQTASSVRQAGADILVSGSFLFRQDLAKGIQTLLLTR